MDDYPHDFGPEGAKPVKIGFLWLGELMYMENEEGKLVAVGHDNTDGGRVLGDHDAIEEYTEVLWPPTSEDYGE